MQTPCPSIGLFKPFRAKPSSTALKSLTRTRCHHCWLFVLHSKLTSSRWSRHSKLAIRRGTKFFMFHFSIWRGKRNFKSSTCFFGVCIRCLRMRNLSLSCLLILISSFFLGVCFLCGMGITSCRLGCFTLTICMMMSPSGTSLLIPLSLWTPLMGLLNFSLPWWSSTSMFLNLFFSLH